MFDPFALLKLAEKTLGGDKHIFEEAGLGVAPFKVASYFECENHCQFCGTRIIRNFVIEDVRGAQFVVGSECVKKTGDTGLIWHVESIENQISAAKRAAKKAQNAATLGELINTRADALSRIPHPMGFVDRRTRNPLTMLDYARWMNTNAGAAGKAKALREIKKVLEAAHV